MRRILLVSKFSRVVGGVEVHLHTLKHALMARGFEVKVFASDLESVDVLQFDANSRSLSDRTDAVVSMFWNYRARASLREVIQSFRPDLIHYHSIYHQLSPAVLGVCDIPSVMTLHDFKLVAPCYTLVRDSKLCDLCVTTRSNYYAVRHRCVQNSLIASATCAFEGMLHLGRHLSNIDVFIAPSIFAADLLQRGGLPVSRLSVVPWGTPDVSEAPATDDWLRSVGVRPADRVWIFVGRLHPAKGIEELVAVWRSLRRPENLRLIVVGEGELMPSLSRSAQTDPSIVLVGSVEPGVARGLYARAELTLVPSIQPETFGLVAVESLRCGTPIVVSGAGALSEFEGPGVVNLNAHPTKWADSLSRYVYDSAAIEAMSSDLSARDLSVFSVTGMTDRILSCYARAGLDTDNDSNLSDCR